VVKLSAVEAQLSREKKIHHIKAKRRKKNRERKVRKRELRIDSSLTAVTKINTDKNSKHKKEERKIGRKKKSAKTRKA